MMRGFTLIEILVTLAVLGVLLLNITLMLGGYSSSVSSTPSIEEKTRQALINQVAAPQKASIKVDHHDDCVKTAVINAGGHILISDCQK